MTSTQRAGISLPTYRLHKAKNLAMVKLGDRVVYLGEWESEASRIKYDRVVAEWRARGQFLPQGFQAGHQLTVDDLIAAYWKHADVYYRKDGEHTSEISVLRLAMRYLHRHCLALPPWSAQDRAPRHRTQDSDRS